MMTSGFVDVFVQLEYIEYDILMNGILRRSDGFLSNAAIVIRPGLSIL